MFLCVFSDPYNLSFCHWHPGWGVDQSNVVDVKIIKKFCKDRQTTAFPPNELLLIAGTS